MLFSTDKLKLNKHSGIQHYALTFQIDSKTSNAERTARYVHEEKLKQNIDGQTETNMPCRSFFDWSIVCVRTFRSNIYDGPYEPQKSLFTQSYGHFFTSLFLDQYIGSQDQIEHY